MVIKNIIWLKRYNIIKRYPPRSKAANPPPRYSESDGTGISGDPLEHCDPRSLPCLATLCLLLGTYCWLLGCSWLLFAATCCGIDWLIGKSARWGPKSTKKYPKMTPKWRQNGLKINPGGTWAALWGPRWASALFPTFVDVILGSILGALAPFLDRKSM